MFKTALKRGLVGIPIGIAVNHIISLVISIIINNGGYYPIVPTLAQTFSNELNAVIIQTVLSGAIGFVFSGASVIWDIERWNLFKKTTIVFLIYSVTIIPINLVLQWIPLNIISILIFYIIFSVIFAIIWVVNYILIRRNLDEINSKLKNLD